MLWNSRSHIAYLVDHGGRGALLGGEKFDGYISGAGQQLGQLVGVNAEVRARGWEERLQLGVVILLLTADPSLRLKQRIHALVYSYHTH